MAGTVGAELTNRVRTTSVRVLEQSTLCLLSSTDYQYKFTLLVLNLPLSAKPSTRCTSHLGWTTTRPLRSDDGLGPAARAGVKAPRQRQQPRLRVANESSPTRPYRAWTTTYDVRAPNHDLNSSSTRPKDHARTFRGRS